MGTVSRVHHRAAHPTVWQSSALLAWVHLERGNMEAAEQTSAEAATLAP